MATITIRKVDDNLKRFLEFKAKGQDRKLDEYVLALLKKHVAGDVEFEFLSSLYRLGSRVINGDGFSAILQRQMLDDTLVLFGGDAPSELTRGFALLDSDEFPGDFSFQEVLSEAYHKGHVSRGTALFVGATIDQVLQGGGTWTRALNVVERRIEVLERTGSDGAF